MIASHAVFSPIYFGTVFLIRLGHIDLYDALCNRFEM